MTLAMSSTSELGELFDDDFLRGVVEWSDQSVHGDEITVRVAAHLRAKSTGEWLEILLPRGFWAGPVYDYEDLADDPHVKERGMIVEIPLGDGLRPLRTPAVPIRMSSTPPPAPTAPPALGADTADVLASLLGWDEERIARLGADPAPVAG
jgi:crotonobetainyl-CoA:carnitine CoA-transferase CaiB-like acyl-CoA transferase